MFVCVSMPLGEDIETSITHNKQMIFYIICNYPTMSDIGRPTIAVSSLDNIFCNDSR